MVDTPYTALLMGGKNSITDAHTDCWNGLRDLFFTRTDRLGRRLPEVLSDLTEKPITGPWRFVDKKLKLVHYHGVNRQVMAQHVSGVLCDGYELAMLQTYAVNHDGTSVWTTIDLDVVGDSHADVPEHFQTKELALEAARKLIARTEALGLTPHLEVTKSAGCRVWIFHGRCPWTHARDLGRLLLSRAGLNTKIEVFPKSAPADREGLGTAVFLPYWGINARRGRQVMIDPHTEAARRVEDFVKEALAHRTEPARLAEIVTAATEAGEIKATPEKRERSERTDQDGDSALTQDAEVAAVCWQAQLAGCEALREMAQSCEDGRALSRAEWMRLATHLNQYGDWGLAEFHRLSSFDSRYSEHETDMLFDSLVYGPTTCLKMECGRDPQGDCGMADGKVSASWFTYRALKQLKMAVEAEDQGVALNRDLAGLDQTDTGNAARLYARHGALLRHSPQEKSWYAWRGDVWARHGEDSPVPLQLSLDAMRKIKDEADTIRPRDASDEAAQKAYEALFRHAMRSQAEPKIKAALSLLRTVSAVRVDPADFDADAELVSVLNGTLDLHTGKLRAHDQDDMITKIMPVEFDPRALCPNFERFIGEVVPNGETRGFLQKWLGYCLTGLTREQIYLYLYGSGKNGKSTLLNVIKMIMGSALHATITSSAVMEDPRGNKDMQRAMLPFVGPRAVTITEVGEGSRLDEELLKAVTGGDPLKVRRLYQEEFEVVPTVKLTMAGNHKPKITGTDPGIWRRVQLVPFETVVQNVDKALPEKLAAEKSGILNWMLAGLAAYYREGLDTPPQVKAATNAYQADSDVLGQFLDERYVKDDTGQTGGGDFYQSYSSWSFSNGHKALSNSSLVTKMKERGYGQGKGRERRTWMGLRIRTASDDAADESMGATADTGDGRKKGDGAQASVFPECMKVYEQEQAERLREAEPAPNWEDELLS